jgi:carbon storage regulator
MLVLNRKVGERIVIADSIVVTVLEVRGNRVRLGLVAPQGVDIRREEVMHKLASTKEAEPVLAGAG